jgi:hypothetical protein
MLRMSAMFFKCFLRCFKHIFQVFYLSFFNVTSVVFKYFKKVDQMLYVTYVWEVRGGTSTARAARATAWAWVTQTWLGDVPTTQAHA